MIILTYQNCQFHISTVAYYELSLIYALLFQVRGAPAIAIVGCLSLAVEISKEEFEKKKALRREVEGKLNYLISARPTAVNMKQAADHLISYINSLDNDESISAQEMQAR